MALLLSMMLFSCVARGGDELQGQNATQVQYF
jgi:hypothetical protein